MNGLNFIFETGKSIFSNLCVVVNTCHLFVPIVLMVPCSSLHVFSCQPGYLSRLHATYPNTSLALVTPMLAGSCKEDKHHVLHCTLSVLVGY